MANISAKERLEGISRQLLTSSSHDDDKRTQVVGHTDTERPRFELEDRCVDAVKTLKVG